MSYMQGPRRKFLSGGAKDERVSQIGVEGGMHGNFDSFKLREMH